MCKDKVDGKAILQESSDKSQKEGKRPWSELPTELLNEVSWHCFASDPCVIGSIRLVSKFWCLASNIARPLPPPPMNMSDSKYPYMMQLHGHVFKFFHPIYNHTFQIDIPELSYATIHHSKDGWLLLAERDGSIFFFNPFTRAKLTLPRLECSMETLTMCFSSLPTSSDCQVVAVHFFGRDDWLTRRGETSWHRRRLFDKTHIFLNCHPIIFNDWCYISGEDFIAVLDLKSGEGSASKIMLPLEENNVDLLCRSFMVENKGELLVVFVPKEEENVYVKAINLSEEVWRPVQMLGREMLYASPGASFMMPAPESATSNKIYFMKRKNGSCVFYSLATSKYHSFPGDYSSRFPGGLQELRNCIWINLKPMVPSGEEIDW